MCVVVVVVVVGGCYIIPRTCYKGLEGWKLSINSPLCWKITKGECMYNKS